MEKSTIGKRAGTRKTERVMTVATFININGENINGMTEGGEIFKQVSLDTMKRVANILVRKTSEFPRTTANVDAEPATREAAFEYVKEYMKLRQIFNGGEWNEDWRKKYDIQNYICDVEDAWSYRDLKLHFWRGYIFMRITRYAYVCMAVFTPDGQVFNVPFDVWEETAEGGVPTFDFLTGSRENLYAVHVDNQDWLPSCPIYVSRETLDAHGVPFCPNCEKPLFARYNAEMVYDCETHEERLTCTNCHADYFWCDIHHRYERNTDRHRIDGVDMCDEGFNEQETFVCEDCGAVHLMRYARDYVDDNGNTRHACMYCAERFMSGRVDWQNKDGLYDYGFKPAPVFYTANGTTRTQPNEMTMGIELEYDQDHRSRCYSSDAHSAARDVMRAFKGAIYCKRDGSLEYGCECVSMPHTIEAWENFDFDTMFENVRTNGLKNNHTCGYHVHINRKAFGSTSTKQHESIVKLAMLMDEHRDMFWRISRRTDIDDFDHWAAVSPIYDEWGDYCDTTLDCAWDEINDGDRYHIVNLTNRATVEIRAWASTMTKSIALGTLEIVGALVKIVNHTDFDTLREWDDAELCENILANSHDAKPVRFLLRKVGLI